MRIKKILKIALSTLLAIILLAGVVVGAMFLNSGNYEVPDQPDTAVNTTGLVQAIGRSLYDAEGNRLKLTGVKIGRAHV